jgi:hypothetical protein
VIWVSVISRSDATELFELVDRTFDQVAVLVEGWIEVSGPFKAAALRNDRPRPEAFDSIEDGVGVIAFVGNDDTRLEAIEKRHRLGRIMSLPGGKYEADRPPCLIDGEVDLGAQTTSGTPQSRILSPPFPVAACWCARTMVLSIIRYSLPRSLVRATNIRSQIPFAAQRVKRL